MTFSSTATTFNGNSSIVRGNVNIVGGTWNAGGNTTPQELATGLGSVLGFCITNEEAHSESPAVELNTPSDGSVLVDPATGDNTGNWFAIGTL